MWLAQHDVVFAPANGDTVSGVGAMAGRSFVIVKTGVGTTLFETSDTVPYS